MRLTETYLESPAQSRSIALPPPPLELLRLARDDARQAYYDANDKYQQALRVDTQLRGMLQRLGC